MAKEPVPIPWPLSSFPGADPQESQGRLINSYVEPLGEQGSKAFKWVRGAGLSLRAVTANSGYRGGLYVNSLSYECWSGEASTIDANGTETALGTFLGTKTVTIARNQAAPTPDVVAVDVDNGAYVLASAPALAATSTITIGGTVFTAGDVVALTFLNPLVDDFPVSVSYTVAAGSNATIIATALKNLINANATLAADNFTATSAGAVITPSHQGAIGNNTSFLTNITTTTGNETALPASGNLTGGQGTYGAFTGLPTPYNGFGSMPAPNSVCFQDGYLFFTVANGQVFASGINDLTMSGLAEIRVQSKADVSLLRGVAFSGLLMLFTTGGCELWQDAAISYPDFPYQRVGVLEYGLIQTAAISGWETGFAELLWVAQDYGVYWMTANSMSAVKASPPDLDRLIESAVVSGQLLEAGCYIIAGKKFWKLSSPDWTWEFNIQTKKWNERQSLNAAGFFGRWRAAGGHPAFGTWVAGDTLTGNLLAFDDANPSDNGAVHRWTLESLPLKAFPANARIARADFDFVVGVGQATGNVTTTVMGAAAGTGGVVRLSVLSSSRMKTGDVAIVAGVTGTTEANGRWTIKVVDATHIELQGSAFVHAFTAGGTVVDLTSPPNAVAPVVAISVSKDGGNTWGNPLIRSLGGQKQSAKTRVSVVGLGVAGPMGVRFRVEVTDPVYVSLLGATVSSEVRMVGP